MPFWEPRALPSTEIWGRRWHPRRLCWMADEEPLMAPGCPYPGSFQWFLVLLRVSRVIREVKRKMVTTELL